MNTLGIYQNNQKGNKMDSKTINAFFAEYIELCKKYGICLSFDGGYYPQTITQFIPHDMPDIDSIEFYNQLTMDEETIETEQEGS